MDDIITRRYGVLNHFLLFLVSSFIRSKPAGCRMVIMIQKMGIMIQKYICPKIGKVGELRLMSSQVTADVHLIFLGGAHLTFFSLESGILSRCLLGPLTFSTVFFFVQVDNSMFLISFQALVASIGLCICTFNVSAFIQVQHTWKNYGSVLYNSTPAHLAKYSPIKFTDI